MSIPSEVAAQTFVKAWQEPDPAARARLIEACFADDGRIVSRGAVIHGRAGLATAMNEFFADPRGLSARLVGGIDAQGQLFRFRSAVEDRDGRVVFDGFDAAEVDAEGRIKVLLTFGPAAALLGP
jgi:hypothetical protein